MWNLSAWFPTPSKIQPTVSSKGSERIEIRKRRWRSKIRIDQQIEKETKGRTHWRVDSKAEEGERGKEET